MTDQDDVRADDQMLYELGILAPDHPSPVAHADRIARLSADFTPLERRLIRTTLLEAPDAE